MTRAPLRAPPGLVAAALALSVLSACRPSETASLEFGPASALFDTPLTATVRGVEAGAAVKLSLSTHDASGVEWRSSATFTADADGVVTLDTPATDGDYRGVDASGLVDALYPESGTAPDTFPVPPRWQLTLTAQVRGRQIGTATVRRLLSSDVGVTTTTVTVAADGVAGLFAEPARTSTRGPAVVVWGGSEGGLSTATYAKALAAHGYPALALAYFKEPGLPSTLSDVPMEYFARAVTYLDRQPGVDPTRVAVSGASRGSEAALLLGVERPDLVHAVIGQSASGVVYGGYPDTTTAAWTFRGAPVPYAPAAQFGNSHPPQTDAVIPVADINAPILLVCGEDDQEWPSCNYASAITRSSAARKPTVVSDPDAGHYVDTAVPWLPFPAGAARGASLPTGGSAVADGHARAVAWPQLLAFLAAIP